MRKIISREELNGLLEKIAEIFIPDTMTRYGSKVDIFIPDAKARYTVYVDYFPVY